MRRVTARSGESLGKGVARWVAGSGGFRCHVGLFLVGATILTLANVALTPEALWFWRPLVAWIVLLGLHLVAVIRGLAPARSRPESALPATQSPAPTRDVAAPATPTMRRLVAASRAALWFRFRPATRPAASYDDWSSAAGERAATPELSSGDQPATPPAMTWGTTATAPTRSRTPPGPSSATAAATWRFATNGRAIGVSRGAAGAAPDASPAIASGAMPVASNGHHPPAPSGRFHASEPSSSANSNGHQNGHAGEHVPASVEALWASAGTSPRTPPTTRPATSSVPQRQPQRPASDPERDHVISGPVPVDPNDPRWNWLEAQAAAWLAQREAAGPPPADAIDHRPTPTEQRDAVRDPY